MPRSIIHTLAATKTHFFGIRYANRHDAYTEFFGCIPENTFGDSVIPIIIDIERKVHVYLR